MCKRHDQRASLLDRRRQKWRWSIALGNWLTLSIFSWMKGKPSLMSRLKNTRRKRKKEKKNNTRKRGTSIYVCVSGTRRREKEKQRRRAVTLTPCNREKPVEQHGIKPRLEEWLSAGAWLKRGYNTGTIDGTLCAFVVPVGKGRKKNFPSEDSPCVKDFPLFASKQGGGCWNITFDRFGKRQAANYPAKWSVKTNRDVHGIHSLADVSQTVWSGAN